jgi:hypothetical protein
VKKTQLTPIGLALSTMIFSGIARSEPSSELATKSQGLAPQSETKQKAPTEVPDWKVLSARLAALPKDQRRATLEALETSAFSTEDRRNYVELLRKLVPTAEQEAALRHLISEVPPTSDYAPVTALLDAIQATPEERKIAMRAAGGRQFKEIAKTRELTQQDLQSMRMWAKTQDPAAMDRVTGEALGQALADVPANDQNPGAGNFTFTNAYMMLVTGSKDKGHDELISGFIKVVTERKVDLRAICVAGKILNPALRKEASDLIMKANNS